jgi:ADP-heptose:LPS heptosyltransferase
VSRLSDLTPPPRRIVLVLPCCIGDVVVATAVLQALRRAWPAAHITWAVGSWSRAAIEGHNLLDAVLDTGPQTLPVRTLRGMARMVTLLRRGRFDLLVSLVRSPLMSVAALLSGIPRRAGLDSGGRGFGYTVRVKVEPRVPRHEARLYLDVVQALGVDVSGCWANVPVPEGERHLMARHGFDGRYIVVNPAGGRNPGMTMDVKRYPADRLALLAERLAVRLQARIAVLAGPHDDAIVGAMCSALHMKPVIFQGRLNFGQIAALAAESLVYIGNDTGLTHYAAAAGAKTVMILGPTDPARYAPFTRDSLALWKQAALPEGGVASGAPQNFDWLRDGIGVEEAEARIMAFVGSDS